MRRKWVTIAARILRISHLLRTIFSVRRIGIHLDITPPAGNTSAGRRPLTWTATRGNWRPA